MKKKIFCITALSIFVCGCGAINFGGNDSVLYELPLSVPQFLVLGNDQSFSIQDDAGDEYFSGKWTVRKDTLIMTSGDYARPFEDLDIQTKEALRLCHGEYFEQYLNEDIDSAICVMSSAVAIFMSGYSDSAGDSARESMGKAVMWLLSEHANNGYRNVYIIKGRCLYDGIDKTRISYVRVKQKN